MYVVTFYSYRGGVGRTTALVNTAIELAHRKRNVLVVDFALRAPGLTSFNLFRPETPQPGVVEYIAKYLECDRSPDIGDYLHLLDSSRLCEGCGKVWSMPAGCGTEEYWQTLDRIDWKELYDLHEGFYFFEHLRLQWQQWEVEGAKLDYVLIDTHAGIGPETQTCTCQLADGVVLVFTPDQVFEDVDGIDWHNPELLGLRRVHQTIHEEAAARKKRALDEDVVTQTARNLEIHFVASKVPESAGEEVVPDILTDYYTVLDREEVGLGQKVIAIPHASGLVRARRPLVREKAGSQLAQAYRQLVNAIITSNWIEDRDGMRVFLAGLQRNPHPLFDPDSEGGRTDEDRMRVRLNLSANDPVTKAQVAACYFLARRYSDALRVIDEALERWPQNASLLWQRACYNRHIYSKDAVCDLRRLLAARSQGTPRPVSQLIIRSELNVWFVRTVDSLEDAPGVDPYVLSALRRLRELTTENQFQEAMDMPVAQELPKKIRESLFSRQPLLAPLPPLEPLSLADSYAEEQNPYILVRDHQWCSLVALLEPRLIGQDSPALTDALHLFIAAWGVKDEVRKSEASLLVERAHRERLQAGNHSLPIAEAPLLALALWQGGRRDAAITCFNFLLANLIVDPSEIIFSYWRCRYIPQELFRTDAYEQLQMVRSGQVQSPALGPLLRVTPDRTPSSDSAP